MMTRRKTLSANTSWSVLRTEITKMKLLASSSFTARSSEQVEKKASSFA